MSTCEHYPATKRAARRMARLIVAMVAALDKEGFDVTCIVTRRDCDCGVTMVSDLAAASVALDCLSTTLQQGGPDGSH